MSTANWPCCHWQLGATSALCMPQPRVQGWVVTTLIGPYIFTTLRNKISPWRFRVWGCICFEELFSCQWRKPEHTLKIEINRESGTLQQFWWCSPALLSGLLSQDYFLSSGSGLSKKISYILKHPAFWYSRHLNGYGRRWPGKLQYCQHQHFQIILNGSQK